MPLDPIPGPRRLPTFPASVLDARTLRRRRRVRRVGVVAVLVLVAAAAGLLSNRHDASGADRYRTATAQARQIDSVLTSVATIEPVTQAQVAFPVAGTVATVDVAVGDTVAVGTPLASLDTADLEQDLRQRQDDLATAELVLATAENGEDPSSIAGGGPKGSWPRSPPTPPATCSSSPRTPKTSRSRPRR